MAVCCWPQHLVVPTHWFRQLAGSWSPLPVLPVGCLLRTVTVAHLFALSCSGPSKSAAVMDGRSVSLSKRQKFFVRCLLSCALYGAALCAGRSVHLHTTVRTDLSACMFVCFVSLVLRPTIHSGSLPAAGLWAWLAKRCVVVCCSTAVNSCPVEFAPASYKVQLLPRFQGALLCCCCFHLGGVGRLGGRIKLHSSYGEIQGQFVLLCRRLWHL